MFAVYVHYLGETPKSLNVRFDDEDNVKKERI